MVLVVVVVGYATTLECFGHGSRMMYANPHGREQSKITWFGRKRGNRPAEQICNFA